MSVTIEEHESCLIVRNTSSKRGALTPELYQAVKDAIAKAEQSGKGAVVITGGEFFCAGGDLKVLRTRAQLPLDERRARIETLHDMIRVMQASKVPLLAAVEGGAAGAGFSLALACDMIFAAEDATFTAAYVKAGLTPDGGLTYELVRNLPRQMVMQICLLGQSVTARRLCELGVVNELTSKGNALEKALDLAKILNCGPRQAQASIRELVTEAQDADFQKHLEREAQLMCEAQGSTDAAEGIASFFEKRMPEFNQ